MAAASERSTYQGDGKRTHLGSFGTAVEAAVCYAKHQQSRGEAETQCKGRVMP